MLCPFSFKWAICLSYLPFCGLYVLCVIWWNDLKEMKGPALGIPKGRAFQGMEKPSTNVLWQKPGRRKTVRGKLVAAEVTEVMEGEHIGLVHIFGLALNEIADDCSVWSRGATKPDSPSVFKLIYFFWKVLGLQKNWVKSSVLWEDCALPISATVGSLQG